MISDCILAGKGKCLALNVRDKNCGTELCPFYKTKEMERVSQSKANKRAEKLGGKLKFYYKVR